MSGPTHKYRFFRIPAYGDAELEAELRLPRLSHGLPAAPRCAAPRRE